MTDNPNTLQPLDQLMTRLGLANGDLVRASTDQLSFKMVQKGRTGRRLTRHIQEKIHNALLRAKPDLKVRRRELFRYEMDPSVVQQINKARSLIQAGKIKYPQFVDRLAEAGLLYYTVDVASHQVLYYGSGGEVHMEQGPAVSAVPPGKFNEEAIQSAITSAQKELIAYPVFLQKIYEAGISFYEVALLKRKIEYKGAVESYKEMIPSSDAAAAPVSIAAAPVETPKPVSTKPKKKKKKPLPKAANSLKARKAKKVQNFRSKRRR